MVQVHVGPPGRTPGVQDRLKQAICLCRRCRTCAMIEQVFPPAAHVPLGDVRDRAVAESREQMPGQDVPVQLESVRPQVGPFLHPRRCVFSEWHSAAIRVYPVAPASLGLFAAQPDISIRLGREGVATGAIDPVRSEVTSLPAARWQFPDAAEPALTHHAARDGKGTATRQLGDAVDVLMRALSPRRRSTQVSTSDN